MTVANNYDPIRQEGNGVTTSFSYSFDVASINDIVVYQNIDGVQSIVPDTDYEVEVQEPEDEDNPPLNPTPTGNVVFYTAPAVGTIIVIDRKTPQTQETPYKTSSGFPAVRVEQNFDKLTLMVQELQDASNRSIKVAETSATNPDELTAQVERIYQSIDNIDTVSDNITDVNTVSGISSDVSAVASNATNINAVAGNSTNINTVAGISSNINTVAGDVTNINTVAGDITNVNTVAGISSAVSTVASNDTNVTTVATNISDVNTVATDISNVNAVGTDISNVNTLVLDLTNVDTVATNISDVNTVATDIANVNSVADDLTNIDAVVTNQTNIDTVAGISSDVTTVSGISANVTTVAGISANVTSVAGNATNINAVAGNNANITAVAGNATNINTVAGDKTNIDTVAGDINRVNLVADDIASVHTVAVDISNVIDVAANKTNIDAVAGDLTNINAVAADLSNIDSASANAQLSKDWATKMDGMVASEDYSAKYYADQARQAASGAVVDGKSITRNSDDELQTVGVIDSNNTTNAIKTWTGTKAQYDAIVTKDANTLYNITDTGEIYLGSTILSNYGANTSLSNLVTAGQEALVDLLYPVGSVYIGTGVSCPLSAIKGTWTLISSGVVTAVNSNVPCKGTGMTMGLETSNNRHFGLCGYGGNNTGALVKLWTDGDMYGENIGTAATTSESSTTSVISHGLTTDETKSGIVGTVSSTTLSVNIWERTA